MLPLFGSRVRDYLHDPVDGITLRLIKVEVADAIKMWEPRVILKDAEITGVPQEFRVLARLLYLLKSGDDGEKVFTVNIGREGISQWLA
jgi:phage baseplate assembly protein W